MTSNLAPVLYIVLRLQETVKHLRTVYSVFYDAFVTPPSIWNGVLRPTCLSVCICPGHVYRLRYVHSSPNILRMLPVAVARSFYGNVAIRYVLPVLEMTSYLHVCGYVDAVVATNDVIASQRAG